MTRSTRTAIARRLVLVPAALLAAVALILTVTGLSPAAATTGFSIVGYIVDSAGPVQNAVVNAQAAKGDPDQLSVATVQTDATGRYELDGVKPGSYFVYAFKVNNDPTQVSTLFTYLGDTPYRSIAQTVTVTNSSIGIPTIDLQPAGGITGTVTFDPSIAPADRIAVVDVFSWDPYADQWIGPNDMETNGIPSGHFSITTVIPGPVLIRVGPEHPSTPFGVSYADGASTWWKSSYDTVTTGAFLTVNTLAVAPSAQQPTRLGGVDRFTMAVGVSKIGYPDDEIPPGGVDTVFIANGLNFPDALSAGPAASTRGPLLLVLPTEVPDVVFTELQRLKPQHIVIVGGSASVTPAVVDRLSLIRTPTRIDGLDRYAVSRQLARDEFDSASTVVIATGANYPDALAAGPLASYERGPVVLVPPGPRLDSDTKQLILDLGADRVMIAGGPASVSPGIESDLDAMPSLTEVTRLSGQDRYEAALNMSSYVQPQDVVLIANGASFPDALAGSWLGGLWGAPILLTHVDCIPDTTAFAMRQRPDYYLLGGPASLTPAVESLTPCS